jgi:hypothetical protein
MATTFNLVSFLQTLKSEIGKLGSRLEAVEYLNNNVILTDVSSKLRANMYPASGSCRVAAGYVVSSLSAYGWYKVQLDQGGHIPCSLGALSGHTPSAVKSLNTLPPYTRVFVILGSQLDYGTIISASPGRPLTSYPGVRDSISQASAHSLATEGFFNLYVSDREIPVESFTKSSPTDATAVGEWGCMTENGPSVFVDPFMSYIRADENCGVWAFWHDQLLRMHGHNLQMRSTAMNLYSFNDEDELSVITGYSPYLWESLGGLNPTALSQQRTETEAQLSASEFALHDLIKTNQTPFHRLIEFKGFLGQGFRKQLRLPPSSGTVYSLGETTDTKAVWEESLAMDGNYHMVSSQGLFLAHVPPFMAVEQTKLPEDGTGDNRANGYDPTGLSGNQIVRTGNADITAVEGTGAALLADDELAYALKWRANHPCYYHNKDWKQDTSSPAEAVTAFNNLSTEHYLAKSQPEVLKVDHREQQADYHKTLSFVSVLRDGTVVIAGPAGEEIRMGGGSIEISCPGDIQLRPGRNAITMAGRDAVVRAKDNVEVSASDNNVWIKAENTMQLLAANSGRGGMFIESRSQSDEFDFSKTGTDAVTSGIVVKSSSTLSMLSENVYVRSGTEFGTGSVIIDAAKGDGTIVTTASNTLNYNKNAIVDYFGTPTDIKSFNEFRDKYTALSGGVKAYDGSAVSVNGSLVVKNGVTALKGGISSGNTNGYVGSIKTEDSRREEAKFEEYKKTADSDLKQAVKDYNKVFTDNLYSDNKTGNDKVIQTMAFSFRSSPQAKASNFKMFESRWAQRARALSEVSSVWLENPVKANESLTYPYPGAEAWLGDNYTKIDSSLYTVQNGGGLGPKPSGQEYEQFSNNPSQVVSLEGNYPVIS